MSVLSFVNDINRSEMDSLKQDTAKIKRNVCKLTYGYHNFDDNGVCKNCGVTSVKIADGNTVHNALYSLSGTSTTEAMNLQLKIVDSTYNLKESYIRSTIDLSDSTTEQSEHVYAYLLNNNYQIYIKPTADIVICNKEMSLTFGNCTSLTDISALANWDVSNVTCMNAMFYNCTSLSDISPLSNWDVSMVLDTYGMFMGCTLLADITPTY